METPNFRKQSCCIFEDLSLTLLGWKFGRRKEASQMISFCKCFSDVSLQYLIEEIKHIKWQALVLKQSFPNLNPFATFCYFHSLYYNLSTYNGQNIPLPLQNPTQQKPEPGKVNQTEKAQKEEEIKIKDKKSRSQKRTKDCLYQPKDEEVDGGRKKYKKDENRNIIPNTINQLFSFLEKKFKSEPIVKKILTIYNFDKMCSSKQYYIYHKLLKQKLNNYLTKAALSELFELVDPEFQIFSLQQQLCFIKINSILLKYYLRGSENPCRLLCCQKANKERKPAYLNASRELSEDIDKLIEEAKSKFDFSVIQK